MKELQQARELPITLIELTTEVLPELENKNGTAYNGCLIRREGSKYSIVKIERWSYDSETGEYNKEN